MSRKTKLRVLEALGWVVLLCLVWLPAGCGSAYNVGYDNPSYGLVWKVDTGLWLEAKNTKGGFTGTWPGAEEVPWPDEAEEVPVVE
jgi:hypothetical protein